jgi:hypothetical protein
MKPSIKKAISAVRNILLENGNRPTHSNDICTKHADLPRNEIHYALRVMCEKKTLSRVKQGTYVLTFADRPFDEYVLTTKKRAKKPRKVNPAIPLEKQLQKWDAEEKKTDWQDLCQKLQNALAKAYVDCDLLEATVAEQKVVIRYLENRTVL